MPYSEEWKMADANEKEPRSIRLQGLQWMSERKGGGKERGREHGDGKDEEREATEAHLESPADFTFWVREFKACTVS